MRLVTFEQYQSRAGEPRTLSARLREFPIEFPLEPMTHGRQRLGALLDHAGERSIVDLNRAFALQLAIDDAGAPEAEADSLLPSSLIEFFAVEALEFGVSTLAWAKSALSQFDAPDLAHAGVVIPEASVHLCAPVPRPGKIIAVAEAGAGVRSAPCLYLKAPSAVAPPRHELLAPASYEPLEVTGSLAIVIGQSARDIAPSDALDIVAGYCPALEVTGSPREGRNLPGSRDGFSPFGPALVTVDEAPDPQSLEVCTTVSGVPHDRSSTKELPFEIREVIALASGATTLEPGDLLLVRCPTQPQPSTSAADARRPLQQGDRIEVEITGLGQLVCYAGRCG